jgi:hypothetical protein
MFPMPEYPERDEYQYPEETERSLYIDTSYMADEISEVFAEIYNDYMKQTYMSMCPVPLKKDQA